MTRNIITFLVVALSAVCLGPRPASADTTFPDKLLREPFKDPKAQARLTKELNLKDITVDDLKRVIEYGYSFNTTDHCPYEHPGDCKASHYVEVRRIIRFSFDDVVSAIISTVIQNEQHGCSSLDFPGSGLLAVQQFRLYFGGGISAKKNFCDDILGTWNIGKASGTWRLAIPANLRPAPAIVLNPGNDQVDTGSIKFGDPEYSASIDSASLFGFIDLDSFFGRLINDIFLDFKLSPIRILLNLFGESTPDKAIDEMMKQVEKAASLLKDFSFQISKPTEEYVKAIKSQDLTYFYPFFIDGKNSGFIQTADPLAQVQWNVVQTAYYPYEPGKANDLFSIFYGFFVTQIDLIDSWGDDDRQHVVSPGESLWSIAGDELGNPRLHNILITYNMLVTNPNALKPGDIIRIPPLWKIFALNNHDKMIRAGDSFWKRYVVEGGGQNWAVWLARVKGHAKNPNRIYPGEIFEALGSGELPD